MCTAATYQTKNFYMGRTLDYEFSYGDEVTITPRNYPFHFRHAGTLSSHYAMIGMAHVAPDNGVDYPLYYDACNEKVSAWQGLTLWEMPLMLILLIQKKMLHNLNLFHGF